MSTAATVPHSVDPTGIPSSVVYEARQFILAANQLQALRRIRAQEEGGIQFNLRQWGGERKALASMLKRFRAAALAEGIPPRILWALARAES